MTIFVTCPLCGAGTGAGNAQSGCTGRRARCAAEGPCVADLVAGDAADIRWPLFCSVILTNARAIREFGAVSQWFPAQFAGNLPFPLRSGIIHQDYQTVAAFTASGLLALYWLFVTLCIRHGVMAYQGSEK